MAFLGLSCVEEARGARRSWGGGVGKTEGRKKSKRRRLGFIARPGARGIDTQCAPHASAKPKVATGTPGRPEKGHRRWGGGRATVQKNYKIATEFILQITLNISKEVENLQKKSCSKSKVLQLCLKEHFQILPPFWNLNLGCIWAFESFQNYSKFYM